MAIKAADIKKLRDKTGAGMMDCKKALTEAEGDFSIAVKHLKELGLATAQKRSGRATNEGSVFIAKNASSVVVIELGCETDFVANNEDFKKAGQKMAVYALEKKISSVDETLKEMVNDTITVIKENISLKRIAQLPISDDEIVVEYIHGGGKIGVTVKMKLEKAELKEIDSVKALGFDLALHAAAFNPSFLNRNKVDATYLKEQEEIFTKQAEALDKPEKVLQGIIKGKVNKHLASVCFVDQPFVKNDKISVAQALKDLSKEVGGKIELVDYLYMQVGVED